MLLSQTIFYPGKPNLPLGLRGKAGGGASVTEAHVARVRTNDKEVSVAGAERSWTLLAIVRILYCVLVVLDTTGE